LFQLQVLSCGGPGADTRKGVYTMDKWVKMKIVDWELDEFNRKTETGRWIFYIVAALLVLAECSQL
jgi:hypothetical protein